MQAVGIRPPKSGLNYAQALSRFDGESTLRATTTNASRRAAERALAP